MRLWYFIVKGQTDDYPFSLVLNHDIDEVPVCTSLTPLVLEYQTAVMRQDFTSADEILPTIGDEHRTRVAQFLEKQGQCFTKL